MHSFALPLAKPIRSCSGLFTGFLGSLALALAGAGPVAANPSGVERQGGDAIAAIKSLTALIEKGNIELPPIEFIELIQEPDGGPTDDFVIPGDFPERGRR